MKTVDDINLTTWFMDRELGFVPDHFIKSSVPLTEDAKAWVLEKLIGRFALINNETFFSFSPSIYFEDSKEALFYELTWG